MHFDFIPNKVQMDLVPFSVNSISIRGQEQNSFVLALEKVWKNVL